MKTYIVITRDGFTEDYNGNETNNCQVIGIFHGESEVDALTEAHNYMLKTGQFFRPDRTVIYRIAE